MIIDYITQFIQTFTNEHLARVFSEPIAILIVFMLVFGLITIFASSKIKRIFLIFILVIVGAFAIFNMASVYGFVQLPFVLGGV